MDKNAALALSINTPAALRASLTSADRASRTTGYNIEKGSARGNKSLTNRSRFNNLNISNNPMGLRTTNGGVYGTQTYQ